MRALIQRVKYAKVTVNDEVVGSKIIMFIVLISGLIYSQDCDEGFTYIANFMW